MWACVANGGGVVVLVRVVRGNDNGDDDGEAVVMLWVEREGGGEGRWCWEKDEDAEDWLKRDEERLWGEGYKKDAVEDRELPGEVVEEK